MKVDAVADVGNSCIKLGKWKGNVSHGVKVVPSNDDAVSHIAMEPLQSWAIAGVVPQRVKQLTAALTANGRAVIEINDYRKIPIKVDVENPESVGVDRLFDAVAATSLFPGDKLLVVDAGTAITINAVSRDGTFLGGAILPGLFLMVQSLNAQTAQLPLTEVVPKTSFPAKNTTGAIQRGVLAAAVGAVELCARLDPPDRIVFTGGYGMHLEQSVSFPSKFYEWGLAVIGIRIAAEALP